MATTIAPVAPTEAAGAGREADLDAKLAALEAHDARLAGDARTATAALAIAREAYAAGEGPASAVTAQQLAIDAAEEARASLAPKIAQVRAQIAERDAKRRKRDAGRELRRAVQVASESRAGCAHIVHDFAAQVRALAIPAAAAYRALQRTGRAAQLDAVRLFLEVFDLPPDARGSHPKAREWMQAMEGEGADLSGLFARFDPGSGATLFAYSREELRQVDVAGMVKYDLQLPGVPKIGPEFDALLVAPITPLASAPEGG